MADDFDDELYNVYNTAKDDAYGNTDIYADYKDPLSGDEHQDGAGMDLQGNDPNAPTDTAANNMGMMESADHDASGQGAAMQAGSVADDGGDASGNNNPQQQMLKALQQQQQQQAMMNNWGQFQPNPYQFAMYQQALQQMMMNPYQLQQMMQRQFRQQPSPTQQQQQQQQPQQQQQQQQQNVDDGPPSVASAANQDEGKMFIGGLNWETTDESLKEYFSQFGQVMDCVVMRDPTTGRSRGFGFLTMADPDTIDKIVNEDHYLDGKRIDPKRAIPREEQDKTEKIFVGGISPDVDEEEFREFFSQFGKVMDATLMTDRETGRPRGFGFITFEDSKGVEEALLQPNLAIKGKTIEVKKAMPKSKQMRQNMMNNPMGSRAYVPNTRYAGAAAMPGARPGYGFGPTNMYGAAMYGGYGGNYGMNPSAFYGRNTGGFGMGGSGGGAGSSSGSHQHGEEDSDYRDDMDQHDRRDYGDDRRSDSRRDDRRSDDRRYDDRRSRNDDRRSRHDSSRHHDSSRYDSRHESRDRDRSSSRAERSPRSSSSGGGAIHASQSARNQHQYRPY